MQKKQASATPRHSTPAMSPQRTYPWLRQDVLPESPATPDKYRTSLQSVRESAKELEPKLRQGRERMALREELRSLQKDTKVRKAQSFIVFLSFFTMGMYYSSLGPSTQDISVFLGEDLFHVLYLLPARGFGVFFGAVVGGTLLRSLNPQLFFVAFEFLLAVACIGVKYSNTLFSWTILFGVGGVASGALNIIGTLWITALWADRSGSMLQASSVMQSLGCTLGPIVCEHFLTARSVRSRQADDGQQLGLKSLNYLSELEDKEFVFVTYAYLTIGLCAAVVITIGLILFLINPNPRNLSAVDTPTPAVPCSCVATLLVACLCLYMAMEVHWSQLLAPYAVLNNYSKTTAAYGTATFWGFYTVFRAVSALWLHVHGPVHLLLASNIILLIATVPMTLFGSQVVSFYVSAAVAGACLAPMFPSILLLLHTYSGVTTLRLVLVMFSIAVSTSGPSLCVGYFIEKFPAIFYYAFLGLVASSCVLVCLVRLALHRMTIDGYTFIGMEEHR